MNQEIPPLDPHPLSEYVAWAGGRNREPILGVLKDKLPKDPERILEMASGSGMHINYFAPHFEHLHFQPTDKDVEVFDNIKELSGNLGNNNIADPVHLDLTDPQTWFNPGPEKSFAAIFCINIFVTNWANKIYVVAFFKIHIVIFSKTVITKFCT